MGRYTKKRNIEKFWENPLVNGCYVLAILSLVCAVFGLFALIGKAKSLPFTIVTFVLGIGLIVLGKKLNARKKNRSDQ